MVRNKLKKSQTQRNFATLLLATSNCHSGQVVEIEQRSQSAEILLEAGPGQIEY